MTFIIGPAFRKIEANAKSEPIALRRQACEAQYRRCRFRDVLALRRMHADFANARKRIMTRSLLILEEVAARHGLTVADLRGSNRKRAIVYARFEAAWRLKTERGASLHQIGKLLGGRDHTTVLHALRKQARMLQVPAPR